MLKETYVKIVMRRINKYAEPKPREHKVGVFECDHCKKLFEIEYCLDQKIAKLHHFCGRRCQGDARKEGGCLNYVYNLFDHTQTIETREKNETNNNETIRCDQCIQNSQCS